jgi:ribonuclease BN (tRNA processing enzyme)
MRLRVIGCAGGSAPDRLLSSYLIDDVLAIDAGSLTTALDLDAQRRLGAVALTHGHLDHVWTLPFFLVHRFGAELPACAVHASAYTLETVQRHLFNDRVWIDESVLVDERGPLATWNAIEPGESTRMLDRYDVTAVALTHTVPSQAYCVRSGGHAVIVCGDTTTTDAVWAFANEQADLRGILVECSWPSSLPEIAEETGHMSAALLAADLAKLTVDVPVHVTHRKPRFEEEVRADLAAVADDRIRVVEAGDLLTFS